MGAPLLLVCWTLSNGCHLRNMGVKEGERVWGCGRTGDLLFAYS